MTRSGTKPKEASLYSDASYVYLHLIAPPRLRGRYMALSTLSWEVGFVIGPAAAGFILDWRPHVLWPLAAAVCLAAGAGALLLERKLPPALRLTPS